MPIDRKTTRKAINFDLDTNILKNIFDNYTTAYKKLKTSFLKNGFDHRQGSGYVSQKPTSITKIYFVLDKILIENDWLNKCVKKFDVTEVGNTFDLTNFFKNNK